jgi:hypothetical protein
MDSGTPIELQIGQVGQLFNTLDPMPFRERDLDREAEDYIVNWARELPAKNPIRILIHLPRTEAESAPAHELGHALNQYFRYRADCAAADLRGLFRNGRYSLFIGVIVLGICLTAGHFLTTMFRHDTLGQFLNEGLIILGWVANWKPIEIFLYDWWPIRQRQDLFSRLAVAEVRLRPK